MAIPRRAGAVLALFMTSALLVTGCNGGDGDEPTEGELYANPVTLTWWMSRRVVAEEVPDDDGRDPVDDVVSGRDGGGASAEEAALHVEKP